MIYLKKIQKASKLIIVSAIFLLLFASQVLGTATINVYFGDLPATSYYVVKTDGTNHWVVRFDGYKAYESTVATTAINWALANLQAGRSYVQKVTVMGSYTLTKSGANDWCLYVSSYTELDLTQAVLTLADSQNCDVIRVQTTNDNRGGSIIRGGKIDGHKTHNTGGDGIYVYGGAQSVFEDITVQNTYGDGFDFNGNWTDWGGFHNIRNCRVWFAGGYGYYANYNNDLYFYRCVTQSSGDSGYLLYGTNFLVECTGVYSGGDCFEVPTSASSNQFIDCYANYNAESGFDIRSDGSRIVNPHVDGSSHGTNLTYTSIYIDASYVQIMGGSIRGDGWGTYHATWNIKLAATATYNVISGGTRCYNAVTGQIQDLGSNNHIQAWNGTTWVDT